MLNPCHFGLARVSVVHGQGELTGHPFIDDYIVTHEPVVDYLTRYSGIIPGDLDPKLSKHHITTLKVSTLTLGNLITTIERVSQASLFSGHWLSFCRSRSHQRLSNYQFVCSLYVILTLIADILVPQDQVVDTVELFHLTDQRKISLRFLASCLLDLDIQADTHDSVEDARTALQLYNKYLELIKENKFQQVLLTIYEIGRKTAWT